MFIRMSHRSLALKSSTVMYRRYCLTARCSGLNLMFSWQLLNLREATALAYAQGQTWTTALEFSVKSRIQDVAVSSWNEISSIWMKLCLTLICLPACLTVGWMDVLGKDWLPRKHQDNMVTFFGLESNTKLWIISWVLFKIWHDIMTLCEISAILIVDFKRKRVFFQFLVTLLSNVIDPRLRVCISH